MNYLWGGSLMALIGLFLLVSALKKSEFIIYKLFVARSKLLWGGDNVHSFFVVVGVILMGGLSSLFFFLEFGGVRHSILIFISGSMGSTPPTMS